MKTKWYKSGEFWITVFMALFAVAGIISLIVN